MVSVFIFTENTRSWISLARLESVTPADGWVKLEADFVMPGNQCYNQESITESIFPAGIGLMSSAKLTGLRNLTV